MPTSLSSLVDNLSKIYKKEWKACKERRKIKSECNLIGLKNNNFSYKCKECNKEPLKPVNGLNRNFVMETLINVFCC